MSTMTDVVGDGGANEGETHSSGHISVLERAHAANERYRQENAKLAGEGKRRTKHISARYY